MTTAAQTVKFDINLLHKYNQPVPRYTSYPPATELREEFEELDFRGAIAAGNLQKHRYHSMHTFPFVTNPVIFAVATPSLVVARKLRNHIWVI